MKKLLAVFLIILLSFASAQGVRSLGMGGVVLPGPWATTYNPAYAAYPASTYGPVGGVGLPLGLINLAVRPSISPVYYFTDFETFQNNFDFISFLDQLTHPYEFIINPPRSPDEIVFHIDADGISVTDDNGNPLNLDYQQYSSSGSGGATELPLKEPFLEIPIPTTVPGFRASVGAYVNAGGFSITPSDNLVTDLANGSLQASTTYTITTTAAAEAGLTGNVSFAIPLPAIPGFEGRVYAGGQIDGFYGLFYDDTKVTATTTTDENGIPGDVTYSSETFLVYPGNGSGYGGRLDFGLAVDYQSATFGLGIRNLYGYERWTGTLRTTDSSGNTSETNQVVVNSEFNPSVFVNGAYTQPLDEGTMLYGADVGYFAGSFTAHAGMEYQLSIFRVRGGLGYEDGLKVGVGGGAALPHVAIDLALTSHQAPFTGQAVYGVAASLGINF